MRLITKLAVLANQGKLEFDDSLAAHVARISPAAASITIHQLLTHAAGLPSECGDDFDRVTREELVSRRLANLTPHAGSTFQYSKLGKSEMAKQMVTSRSALDRLLDPDNPSVTLRALRCAIQALGGCLKVELAFGKRVA